MQRRDRAVARGGAGGGLLPGGGRGGVAGAPRRGGRIKWFVLGLALIGCARMAGLLGSGSTGGGPGSGTRAARMLGDALGGAAGWAGAVAPAGAKVAGGLGSARGVYGNPPPAKAPRSVASPPPRPPPAPGTPPPMRDPECRTCGVATMLDFNTHAVKLFKQIDGNTNRGLFVRAPRCAARAAPRAHARRRPPLPLTPSLC
jgi:hypothetical protein